MSLLIGNDLVVSIHYTLTNNAGDVLDSSEGSEPLTYLHGAGNIIPGLEAALVGKVQGDSLEVTVQPEDGYGQNHPELIQTVPKSIFEGVETLEVGMVFQTQASAEAPPQLVSITAIEGDDVTIDGNHPLAGEVLNFAVKVESVREASASELENGHTH